MKTATVLALLLVVALTTCATRSRPAQARNPTEGEPAPAAKGIPPAAKPFPAGWAGTYRGKLEVLGADGTRQAVEMDFIVAPTSKKDRVSWVIGYEGQPRRNYELVTVDAAKGLYKIDEKNSIEITAHLIGNELVSIFAVAGNQLVARYRLSGETLMYEVILWPQQATGMTGGKKGIPVVATYTPRNVQKAVLRKVK